MTKAPGASWEDPRGLGKHGMKISIRNSLLVLVPCPLLSPIVNIGVKAVTWELGGIGKSQPARNTYGNTCKNIETPITTQHFR